MDNIKILQLNIWYGKLSRHLLRYIEDTDADVICLQEVLSCQKSLPYPDNTFDILEQISAASRLDYLYFSAVASFDVYDQTQIGNAILSRFPISEEHTIFTNGSLEHNPSSGGRDSNVRNLQTIKLTLPSGQQLNIANHHAHWAQDPLGNSTSIQKMNIVAQELKKLNGPIIFCGDLNLSPESPAMRVFDDWMIDHIVSTETKTTLSGLNVPFDVVCDHIMTNDSVTVQSMFIDNKATISDHLPLIMHANV